MAYKIIKKCGGTVGDVNDEQLSWLLNPPMQGNKAYEQRKQFLSNIQSNNQWIRCGCNEKAIIYVGQSSVPYVYTKKNSKYQDHDPICKFANGEKSSTGKPPKPLLDTGKFNLQPKPKDNTRDAPKKKQLPSTSRSPENPFFKLIRGMFLRAELNICENGQQSSYQKQKHALESAASMILIDKEVKASSALCINAKHQAIQKKIFSIKNDFTNNCPMAICLWVASSYTVNDDKYILDLGEKIPSIAIDTSGCEVKNMHTFGSNENGPFIFAAIRCLLPKGDGSNDLGFFYTKLLIIPIMSLEHWIFVDSHNERVFGKQLLKNAKYWRSKANVKSKVTKPLENFESGQRSVRPDFDITLDGERLFVEVMGFDNEIYRSQKATQVPAMEETAPVKSFYAYKYKGDVLDDKSFLFVKNIFGAHLFNREN